MRSFLRIVLAALFQILLAGHSPLRHNRRGRIVHGQGLCWCLSDVAPFSAAGNPQPG